MFESERTILTFKSKSMKRANRYGQTDLNYRKASLFTRMTTSINTLTLKNENANLYSVNKQNINLKL